MNTYPVSSKTEIPKLAGAIRYGTSTGEPVKLQAVGAGAVNQAIKAVAVARQMTEEGGADLFFTPSFQNITLDGESRTMIEIKVEARIGKKEEELQSALKQYLNNTV